MSKQDNIVCNIIKEKCSPKSKFWSTDMQKVTKASAFWKGISKIKDIFKIDMKFRLGEGKDLSF